LLSKLVIFKKKNEAINRTGYHETVDEEILFELVYQEIKNI